MSDILGVGVAALDIINVVDGYPDEDTEVRALAHHVQRGGNAANTLVVLSQLGHRCSFAGTLSGAPMAERIVHDLERHRIDTRYCRRYESGGVPTSCICVNRRGGSRSIVHFRDLPEFSDADFASVDPARFHWLHFEGRNVPETRRMLRRVQEADVRVPCSVEIEKPRSGIETLYPYADLLLFSRAFVQHEGCDDPLDFLAAVRERTPAQWLVCAWGADGAAALDRTGHAVRSGAAIPDRVVDTLGAGDVFNAAVIHARVSGWTLEEAVAWACGLAGRKCGQWGLDGLSAPATPSGGP